jgi:hypothetical protein
MSTRKIQKREKIRLPAIQTPALALMVSPEGFKMTHEQIGDQVFILIARNGG